MTPGDEAANLKNVSVSVPRLIYESAILNNNRAVRRRNNEVGVKHCSLQFIDGEVWAREATLLLHKGWCAVICK